VKLLALCVLFSVVFCGNVANCCDVEHDGIPDPPDTAWFVYAPPDVFIQCHLALLGGSYAANIDPNLTGWGWEINGCSRSKPLSCGGGAWCDDDYHLGGGTNTPVTNYVDSIFSNDCGITRTYRRRWSSFSSCEDGRGILTIDQLIHIVDTIAPTLAIPYDLEYECPPIAPNVNDVSLLENYFGSPDVIDFCQAYTDDDITKTASAIDGTGTFTRTFFISDGCNDSSGVQTITLVDTTPPVLQRLPNLHLECGAAIPNTAPNAQDTCYRTNDANILVTANPDITYPGTCAGKYSLVRVWTASDPAGNSVSETQIIVIDDTTVPVVAPPPVSTVNIYTVQCFSDITFPYTHSDTCSGVENANVPYDISLSHNEDEGRTEVLVEYTSSDLCGNTHKWADLWQVESGLGIFSDVISGPTSLVDKGVPFTITIDITATNRCIPFGILLVDTGYATLQGGSDTCFFQAASGVVYCDPVPTTTPYSLVLNLAVPADYLGDDLLVSISWHYNYKTIAVVIGSYLVSFNP